MMVLHLKRAWLRDAQRNWWVSLFAFFLLEFCLWMVCREEGAWRTVGIGLDLFLQVQVLFWAEALHDEIRERSADVADCEAQMRMGWEWREAVTRMERTAGGE